MSEFKPNGVYYDKDGKALEVYDAAARAGVEENSKKIVVLSVANAKLSEDKIALPKENGVIVQGTVGQFAVSDGKGGITWKTLAEAEEVSY